VALLEVGLCINSVAGWWLSSSAYLDLLLLIMLCCHSDSERYCES